MNLVLLEVTFDYSPAVLKECIRVYGCTGLGCMDERCGVLVFRIVAKESISKYKYQAHYKPLCPLSNIKYNRSYQKSCFFFVLLFAK